MKFRIQEKELKEAGVNKLLKLFIDYCFYSLVPIEYAEIDKAEILDKIREATK